MGRNSLDPPEPLASAPHLVDQGCQVRQIVRSQERLATRGLAEHVGLVNVGPRREDRAKSARLVEEHHPVFAPVLSARSHHDALAAPRMERMGDLELYAPPNTRPSCSSGPTRTAKPSASSSRRCANGPTAPSITIPRTEPPCLIAGST